MRFLWATYLIVTASDEETATEIKYLIKDFLTIRGLKLSEEKTIITKINNGFDFLGWNIRKYNEKLIIKPSKKSIKKITDNIGRIIKSYIAKSQDELIDKLNPIITGWSNYHQISVSAKVFSKVDDIIFKKLWSWALRRHGNKGKKWIKNKYWKSEGKRNWVFKDNKKLKLMTDKKIIRHIMIRLDENPYLNKNYFERRKFIQGARKLTGRFQAIWKRQKGKSCICNQPMSISEERELRHIIPLRNGGDNNIKNLMYVHRYCH